MKTQKAPLSIRIIYWMTNIVMGLLILVLLGTIVFNTLVYTDFFGNDLQLHTQFPVKVDFLEEGTLHLSGQDIKVKFVNAVTQIHFFNTPLFIAQKIGLALMIIVFGIVYLMWKFRKFMLNVKNGQTFTIENIGILKELAYGIVGIWLFTLIYMHIFSYFIAKNIEFENVHLTNEVMDYSGILLVALFIWVLAHIFITGLKLQEEKDLTI